MLKSELEQLVELRDSYKPESRKYHEINAIIKLHKILPEPIKKQKSILSEKPILDTSYEIIYDAEKTIYQKLEEEKKDIAFKKAIKTLSSQKPITQKPKYTKIKKFRTTSTYIPNKQYKTLKSYGFSYNKIENIKNKNKNISIE